MKNNTTDLTQSFYDNLASQYYKLFYDWQATIQEQGRLLNDLFLQNGFSRQARVLDCACGIGTQSIGLALLGYDVTASDLSAGELAEAEKRAAKNHVQIRFAQADFCALSDTFSERFNIIIAMDNALPHMLSASALASAVKSITNQLASEGMFVASIRDYDKLLEERPTYSAPYIHKSSQGQRIAFQTWDWMGENYKFTQYIIDDENSLQISKFECEYRATRREELTELLLANGCKEVRWLMPEETGFYQPIVIAKK